VVKRSIVALVLPIALTVCPSCELLTGIHERQPEPETGGGTGSDTGTEMNDGCAEGLVDCDGLLENGCETDLRISKQNCGACNHDCRGGACSASICKPFVMAKDSIYPFALAVSKDGIFWLGEAGDVHKLPLSGGNILELVPSPGSGVFAQSITVSSEGVLWTIFNYTLGEGFVMSVEQNGSDPKALFAGQNTPAGIVTDETSVYWVDEVNEQVLIGLLAGGTPTTTVPLTPGSAPWGIAVDSTHVYWTEKLTNEVRRRSLQGSTLIETLATFQKTPYAIAVGKNAVYWTNVSMPAYNHGSVKMRLKEAGGEPITLATEQDAPNTIVVDPSGAAVYWTTAGHDPVFSGNDTDGAVMMLRLENGLPIEGVTPVVLAKDQAFPTGLALHDGYLYWSNYDSGEIVRMVP
jgi:hypothetical protein